MRPRRNTRQSEAKGNGANVQSPTIGVLITSKRVTLCPQPAAAGCARRHGWSLHPRERHGVASDTTSTSLPGRRVLPQLKSYIVRRDGSYHGVVGPHSGWRREIVPRAPTDSSTQVGEVVSPKGSCGAAARAESPSAPAKAVTSYGGRSDRLNPKEANPHGATKSRASALAASGAIACASAEDVRADASAGRHDPASSASLTPNIPSVRHWSRLLGGLRSASSPRLRWSQLLRRTFDVDVLSCANCGGRLRMVEAVVDTTAARGILERLGLPTHSPRSSRARDPTIPRWRGAGRRVASRAEAGSLGRRVPLDVVNELGGSVLAEDRESGDTSTRTLPGLPGSIGFGVPSRLWSSFSLSRASNANRRVRMGA